MGSWSEQQEARKEGKEHDKARREKLAGFFYDIAKLVFAGLLVGGLSPLFKREFVFSVNEGALIVLGLIFTGCLAGFANRILK